MSTTCGAFADGVSSCNFDVEPLFVGSFPLSGRRFVPSSGCCVGCKEVARISPRRTVTHAHGEARGSGRSPCSDRSDPVVRSKQRIVLPGRLDLTYPPAVGERRYHVAQVNIGRLRAPLDSPLVQDFVAQLDPINHIADRSPGFVWRLQTEDGNATAIRPFEDETLLVNMSVWESVEALGEFVYASRHLDVLRRRKEWFERIADPIAALWWIPAGNIPTLEDAEERLEHLRVHGPTSYAFTLRTHFRPPSDLVVEATEDDRWPCPVD